MAEETPKERRDRELGELMQELRVALPGVQVLFAFLLTVPFTDRFAKLTGGEQDVYFAAVTAAALASLLLIAPAASHRLLFRRGERERLLNAANRVVIVGFAMLGLALGLSLYLVSTVVFGGLVAVLATAGVAVVTVFFWFVFPLLLDAGDDED